MFWFRRKEKQALDDALVAAAKMGTALIVDRHLLEGHLFAPTTSHFGGNPYFEHGEAWPTYPDRERPYDFVCQVNLDECPVRPEVPFDLFTVFFCWASVGDEDGDRALTHGCVVRTYQNASPEKAVSIARPPPSKESDYQVRPCAIRTEPLMTYPTWLPDERFAAIASAASNFWNPRAAIASSIRRLGWWDEFQSRVGGYPTWVHDNILDQDDLIFLAQIDYEPEANNCIGDAAPIYIAVTKDDPPKIETDFWQSF
jgi:hypothetical protein